MATAQASVNNSVMVGGHKRAKSQILSQGNGQSSQNFQKQQAAP